MTNIFFIAELSVRFWAYPHRDHFYKRVMWQQFFEVYFELWVWMSTKSQLGLPVIVAKCVGYTGRFAFHFRNQLNHDPKFWEVFQGAEITVSCFPREGSKVLKPVKGLTFRFYALRAYFASFGSSSCPNCKRWKRCWGTTYCLLAVTDLHKYCYRPHGVIGTISDLGTYFESISSKSKN